MKIFEKTRTVQGPRTIKRYKFLGISLFKKDINNNRKKIKLLGIPILNVRIKKQKKQIKKIGKNKSQNIIFPNDAISIEKEFNENLTNKHKRIAIFASFSENGKIPEYVIYYLSELKKLLMELYLYLIIRFILKK